MEHCEAIWASCCSLARVLDYFLDMICREKANACVQRVITQELGPYASCFCVRCVWCYCCESFAESTRYFIFGLKFHVCESDRLFSGGATFLTGGCTSKFPCKSCILCSVTGLHSMLPLLSISGCNLVCHLFVEVCQTWIIRVYCSKSGPLTNDRLSLIRVFREGHERSPREYGVWLPFAIMCAVVFLLLFFLFQISTSSQT